MQKESEGEISTSRLRCAHARCSQAVADGEVTSLKEVGPPKWDMLKAALQRLADVAALHVFHFVQSLALPFDS